MSNFRCDNNHLPNALQDLGSRRHLHGFNVPLFWLKSSTSCGIGDFLDLKRAIDFCAQIEWQIIQLLPLCDTWEEASPYSAISSLSLNWVYLDLSSVLLPQERFRADQLNALPTVSYPRVRSFKRGVIERLCEEGIFWSEALDFSRQQTWVEPYARFCSLKEIYRSTAWWTWPPTDEKSIDFQRRCRFFITAQYWAYRQLREVKEYAEKRSIFLKGDLPILMSLDSCDVWRHPDWFDLEKEVGAPPDLYAPLGQNWGLPPYRWDAIEQSDYRWWRERLQAADHGFHLYRLDHIAGFFRLWTIPRGKKANQGAFWPEQFRDWESAGRRHLQAILTAGKAIPIGEDLGDIPSVIRKVMAELGIPGTKVLRWERSWGERARFTPIKNYPSCSLTCVSTHDSQTLSQWWRECPLESKLFASSKAQCWTQELTSKWRWEILRDAHASNSVLHINLLSEYVSLFPEISPSIAEQRINVPGTVSQINWTCRCPVYFQEISNHSELIQVMRLLASENQ